MPQAPTPPPQIRHDVSLEISVRLTFLAQLISWSSATTINNFRSNWEMQVTGHWTDVDRRAQGLSYIQIVYNVNFRWIRFKRLIRKVRALFNAFKNIDLLLKQYLYFSHLGWLVGNHLDLSQWIHSEQRMLFREIQFFYEVLANTDGLFSMKNLFLQHKNVLKLI